MEKGRSRKKNTGRTMLVRVVLCICAVLLASGILHALKKDSPGDDEMEPLAVYGIMPGKTPEQLDKELNRTVGPKVIAYTLNSHPEYIDGKSAGTIMFENPESNRKYTRLELVRDDTGDVIYETGLLDAGSYVEKAPLEKNLEAGEYPCTAYIYGYSMDNQEYIGKISREITVTVKN